ncbi:MAG TPA: zinc-binding dehydrogenase [Anaerolineales bacterium]|nr:zinc-binding dehydrogenase [Anaerolineales bacterium]
MKAIQFNFTIPRYVLGLAFGKVSQKFFWSGLTCTQYQDIPAPQLPGEDWVVVKTRLGGICGTDMSAVKLTASTYSTPLVTFPFVLGHENIGRIDQIGSNVEKWAVGDRVVVEPSLWCKPRGIEELCPFCAKGEINHCVCITEGKISPGISIGLCHDTGGSWAPNFVAHEEQLYRVPDIISDENGLMIEPFSIALHAALQNFPKENERVLVIGAGTIGLCMIAALRALGSNAEIIALVRYGFQADAAKSLGATQIIRSTRDSSFYNDIVDLTGAALKRPVMGKPMVIGGVDRVFDCVGSNSTLDDAMRLTRNGGRVIFVGEPGIVKNLDWTPIFTQDLEVKAAYLYHHVEEYQKQQWKAFDLAIDLMKNERVDIGWLVTHKYQLEEYKQALSVTNHRRREEAIKVVFEFPD